MQARFFLLALAAALALRPAPGNAGEKALEVQTVSTATGRYLVNHQWNAVEVTVNNPGDKTLKRGIRVQLGDQPNRYLRVCEFPPRSVAKVAIPVYADYPESAYAKMKQQVNKVEFDDGTKYTFYRYNGNLKCTAAVVDLDNGSESARRDDALFALRDDMFFTLDLVGDDELPPLPLSGPGPSGLPLVLGTDPRHDTRYAETETPCAAAVSDRNYPDESFEMVLRTCNSYPEKLPADPLFWRGVRLCFVGSLRLQNGERGLTPMQKNELLRWVRGGGRLVVMPAPDVESYLEDPFWAALLPVSLAGTRPFTAADGEALAKWAGGKKVSAKTHGRTIASALPAPGGETLAAANGEVLLARRALGAGEVWFSACTGAALNEWSDGQILTRRLMSVPAAPAPGVTGELWAHAPRMMQEMIGIPAPPKTVITAIMLFYLILATLVLVVLRLRKQAELGWPVLLLTALFLFGLSFYLLRSARTKAGLRDAELGVTVSDGDVARNFTLMGLTAPSDLDAPVQMEAPARLTTCSPVESGVVAATYAVRQAKTPRVEQVNLHVEQFWSGAASSEAPAELSAEVSLNEKGITGKLENRSGAPLAAGALHFQRAVVPLGEIPAKGAVKFAGRKIVHDPFAGLGESSPPDLRRRRLLADARRPERGDPQTAGPLVCAFSDAARARFKVGETAATPSACQLEIVVPRWVPPAKGSKVFLPAGVCRLEFPDVGAHNSYFGYPRRAAPDMGDNGDKEPQALPPPAMPGWLHGNGHLRVRARFAPPVKVAPESAAVVFKGRFAGLRGKISVRAPGQKDFKLLKALPAGKHDLKVPLSDLKKYGGLPEFELSANLEPGAGASLTSARWDVEVFDLEITGTVEE